MHEPDIGLTIYIQVIYMHIHATRLHVKYVGYFPTYFYCKRGSLLGQRIYVRTALLKIAKRS